MTFETSYHHTEISLRDAILLAIRKWPWLIFVPLIVATAVTGTYLLVPAPHRAIAVFNVDMAALRVADEQLELGERSGLSMRYENVGSQIIATANASKQDVAIMALNDLAELLLSNTPTPSKLTSPEWLELRAQRQYLDSLKVRMASDESTDELELGLLQQEVSLVVKRIAQLEQSDRLRKAEPVVAKGPTVIASRMPPTQNVLIFSFLFSLFVVWALVYWREQGRLRRATRAI